MVFVVGLLSPWAAFSQAQKLPIPDNPQLALFSGEDQLLWLDDQYQLNNNGHDALSFIQSASVHGLDPDHYHLSLLQSLSNADNINRARYFDSLLSDALLDLIHDIAIGRMNPAEVDPKWFIARDTVDPGAILQTALLSGHLKNSLNQLIPRAPQYHHLTDALSRYLSYAERGGWQSIPAMSLLKPGETSAAMPLIRARLAMEDIYQPDADKADSQIYDEALVTAVKQFQYLHGLKVDGVIGNDTLAALNISARQLVDIIRINLERFRWLPDDLGPRYLLINLGSYQLNAVENNREKLEMKVIVGKKQRPTPSFSSAMTHVVINPYWNVPPKLARNDLLPKQQADPDYFFLHDFNVYLRESGFQTEVDPYRVNWNEVSASHFPYRLQQRPGKFNALGQLKFMFPNPFDIYLHDTPDKHLFSEAQRNFSSGCIRVEKPVELGEFVLNEKDARTSLMQKIASGLNLGERLQTPLPVYAVYFTVWPDKDTVRFSTDPYQRDKAMLKRL
jgi:murein L,D-transpeptidase YcbB/YkuD